eukprot:CAMPEP_0177351654 /NCGR_PEP_ID=MMETSP0368-20130122/31946_1 /TAXON_ID=447022 ORGANISM="Scrippsiella hangoei-like, Strain SHHI-4" /NCGR_SAMPLE_ID=MMETSP0368 /ASSEMBLY_ACC=CAM_ASM_000363 /LENGTH=210 /DNA_ID=CAMNT_0018813611 /DNA_START=67 /DNA_END=699 /DNA_ORIENTATION=+
MKVISVVFAGTALVATAWPTPDKFKPLIEACDGMDALNNCTSHFDGVCTTDENSDRSCHHECHEGEKTSVWSALHSLKHAVKETFGMKGHREHQWPRQLGDCGSKKDGEKCSAGREGRCVPSGKCPIFQGQMVCKPWDAHPPSFITKPCGGKQVGSDCSLAIIPGKCQKAKYEDELVCKAAWPFASETAAAPHEPPKAAPTAESKVDFVV